MKYNYLNVKTKQEDEDLFGYLCDVPCPTCGKLCGAGVVSNRLEKIKGCLFKTEYVAYYRYECMDDWEDGCGTTWEIRERKV